jgi:hypothetical protein
VVGTATQSGVVGTAYTTTVGSTIANSDTNPGTLSISVPTGSKVTMADNDGANTAGTTAVLTSSATGFAFTASSGAVAITATPTSFAGTVSITPDVPGTYSVTFTTAGPASATAYIHVAGAAGTVGTAGLGTKAISATAGGQAAFTFTNASTDASGSIYNVTSSGVGTLITATGKRADGTTNNNPVPFNGSAADFSAGAKWTTGDAASATSTYTVSSAVAGTQTISITKIDAATGAPTASATVVITWNSGTSLNLASLAVSILPGDDTTNCTVANKSAAAHNTVLRVPASDQTNNAAADADLCVIATNGAGNAVTLSALTVAATGAGLIGQAEVGSTTYGIASVSTDLDGAAQFNLAGSLISGKGTYTVTAKALNSDGTTSTTLTGTASVNFTDSKVATATITQTVYALDVDDSATTVATYKLLDKNGFGIASGSTGAGNLLVDSDNAATLTVDAAGESDALATAVTVSTATSVAATGVVTAGVIQVDCAAAKYEKLTIWMHYESNTVPSNKITVYCSEAAAHTWVLDAKDSAVGEQQSVTVTATAGLTGKLDYPVADATTATFSTTQGSLSSTGALTFENGVATVKFNAPLIGGPVTITALPSAVTATTAITTTAGTSKTITIEGDSTASLALDAANAATDAANNAYDEAQNATQAASDALAAVTALAAQVKSLIASVKKLTSAVAKLKK